MKFLFRHDTGNRLGILSDHVLHDNARQQWPFIYRTSMATQFVADTSKGKPYTPHHLMAQLKAGDKVATWCLFAMRYVNSSGQEIMCAFEPSSIPQGQGTTTHRTASDGWHGGSHSLIQWFEELPHYLK
jgi:hypothetical protein